MKSGYLLNSCNSTSQFIAIMFRCSCFCLFVCLFFSFFFLTNKELPFCSVGEPLHTYIHTLLARPHGAFQSQFEYMITGIYLHDPLPFNGPFFMTPPFFESQKVVTLPLFPPPPPLPLLESDKSLNLMSFPWNFRRQTLYRDRSVLNTNSKIYLRKTTGRLLIVKKTM